MKTYILYTEQTYIILSQEHNKRLPDASSSKQANAFLMTSSGSVPFNFSPNIVKNMVKLIGPGAQFIISSRYWSVGFFPVQIEFTSLLNKPMLKLKANNSWQQTLQYRFNVFVNNVCPFYQKFKYISHHHTEWHGCNC